MFIARIELKLAPTHRDTFRGYATTEGRDAQNLEGCVAYAFLEDVADPHRVVLYEEWATRDAFEAYKASPAFAAAGAKLRPMLAAPPTSAYYESENLFASCAVR